MQVVVFVKHKMRIKNFNNYKFEKIKIHLISRTIRKNGLQEMYSIHYEETLIYIKIKTIFSLLETS